MKSGFKNQNQVEFTDLAMELIEKFGYSQNDIAKVARCSASMVSQVLAGDKNPKEASLAWLRKEHEDRTNPQAMQRTEADPLHDAIEHMKRSDPAGYAAARAAVLAVRHRPEVSSGGASEVPIAPASASALARRELQESQQRRGAGGPSGRKRGRGRGAGPGTKGQPGTPGQVQE